MKRKQSLWEHAEPILDSAGTVVARKCPRCEQIDLRSQRVFNQNHGPDKCLLVRRQQPPQPLGAAAGAPLASAAAGDAGHMLHGRCWTQHGQEPRGMPAADVAADEVWFDATDQWECDASNPQDSGSWIPPADGTSGSSAAAFEADAAAAFQHAQQSYQQLLEEGASAELIRDQFGEAMYAALLAGQQPNAGDIGHSAGSGAPRSDIPGPIAAALAEHGFTEHQQQLVEELIEQQQQQQQQQQDGASPEGMESASDCSSDDGVEVDAADGGLHLVLEDAGVAQDLPTHSSSGAGQSQWYKDHLTDHLWECGGVTSRLRIHQAIFMLMSWKADFCVRDVAFAALLGMLSQLLLPEGNHLPGSYYLMKQIMEVRDISELEWHACETGCTGWQPTPKSHWHKHKDDCCKKCKGKRFKMELGRPVPVRRFWFVLPEDSIQELMADPGFVEALMAPKVAHVGSFWSSSEFKHLNKAVGGVLSSPQHGVIELGFDFAEPYNSVKHSTGLMFMRYGSLPEGASARREWHKLVLCIEGPTEPTVMDAFLLPLVKSLQHLAPAKPAPQQQQQQEQQQPTLQPPPPQLWEQEQVGSAEHGLLVSPAVQHSSGSTVAAAAFTHFAVLSAVYADSPARAKLMYAIASWTAYLACSFCKLMGTMTNTVVRYLGYAAAVQTTVGAGAGQAYQMGHQNSSRLLTEPEQRAQAAAAAYNRARGFEPPPGNRFKGYSPLLRDLYWVHFSRLWVVPFCHAFFLGVFKNFMSVICAKERRQQQDEAAAPGVLNPLRIPNDARQVMRSRVASMQLHPSFNRKFRNPFTNMASWQIEDCARALQCFLPMIFRPVRRAGQQPEQVLKPELAKKAFGHLKRFAAFHLGHVTYSNQAEYILAAQQAANELLEYGKLAEQNIADGSVCTFNLHLLACQLLLQALSRGATYELYELWVERMIGEFKQRVKYRTRAEPEKTMMADDMLRRALQRWRLRFAELQTWQQFSGQEQCPRRHAFGSDAGQLLGSGKQVGGDVWSDRLQSAARNAVVCNIADAVEKQLWLDNWEELSVTSYKEALLPGGFYATSAAFTRSRSRDGSFVVVPFREGDEDKPWVARVRCYLQLVLPAAAVASSQRGGVLLMAVCDLLPYLRPFEDEDICGTDSMILYGRDKGSREATFRHLDYPVLLSNIHAPLFRQEFEGTDGCVWWAFVPLQFKTGGKR